MGVCTSSPAHEVAFHVELPHVPAVQDGQVAAAQAAPPAGGSFLVKQKHAKKRIAIAADALTTAANVVVPTIFKTEVTRALIERAVAGNLLFDMLTAAARQAIINSMAPIKVAAGTNIILQGDKDATKFYVLESGTASVLITDAKSLKTSCVLTYEPGSGFGELALLYSAPRAATVQAKTVCNLWVMERTVYAAIKRTFTSQLAAEKRALLDCVPLLHSLSQQQKQLLADSLEVADYQDGSTLFRCGEVGDRFYLLKEGTVLLSKPGDVEPPTRLAEGASFGERSIIKDETREVDAVAEGYVVCYTLNRKAFNEVLGPIQDIWRYEALRKVPILFNLSEPQRFQLAQCMKARSFAAGQLVFSKGDQGDMFYVIEEGSFIIYDNQNAELARIGKGSCFGELALLWQDVRAANVRAVTAAQVLALHRDDFNRILGTLKDIRHMWRFEALCKVPLLSPLTPAQRSKMCTVLRAERHAKGDVIVRQGEEGDKMFIVEAGVCVVRDSSGKELTQLTPTMFFGELALLHNEARAATVLAQTEVNVLVLQRRDFDALLGPLQALLSLQVASYASAKAGKPLEASKILLGELEKVAVLGAGAFGQVTLVKRQGSYYALKVLSKAHIVHNGLQEHMIREKAVMAECASPFMVALVAGFQDDHFLYLLLEAVLGGEFFTYLQTRTAPLQESHARFYAAAVVLGLEYMQNHELVWRDLKPENLLISTDGYLKMADFGFAKRLPVGQKTYTLCGTPEYLAPELVKQSGHTGAVDWWALGVLIYEMVAGYPPFYNVNKVHMFKAICDVRYSFPSHFSGELRDLVRKLLVHNPAQRLGCAKNGASAVKEHPWFDGFDWEAFSNKTMPAPYVPKLSSAEDISNFDSTNTEACWSGDTRLQRYRSTGIFKNF